MQKCWGFDIIWAYWVLSTKDLPTVFKMLQMDPLHCYHRHHTLSQTIGKAQIALGIKRVTLVGKKGSRKSIFLLFSGLKQQLLYVLVSRKLFKVKTFWKWLLNCSTVASLVSQCIAKIIWSSQMSSYLPWGSVSRSRVCWIVYRFWKPRLCFLFWKTNIILAILATNVVFKR